MARLAARLPEELKRDILRFIPDPLWRRVRVYVHGQSPAQRAARRARMRLRAVGQASGYTGAVTIHHDDQVLVARNVDRFATREVLARHFGLVADALEKHGVPYVVLDADHQRRRLVVVSSTHRDAAVAALQAELRSEPTYVAAVRNRKLAPARLVGRAMLPRHAPMLRVFQVHAGEGGIYLAGPELGCDLQFWEETAEDAPAAVNGEAIPAGSLIAPGRNRWADIITPEERGTELALVDGVRRPVLSALRHPHLFTVTEPVDAVYTWVDGSDPEWLLRKAETQAALGSRVEAIHALAANESRYLSRDELRYSLRSLDMYADWVRHIYLVTDDQVPDWLDTTNPRLTVLSHRELFRDRGRLPTFNSHAIETQLHHIEGLSEHYLYLNDDVFFGRPVSPELFFHSNGLAKFFVSHAKVGVGAATPDDMPVMSAAKNNRDLVVKMFDRTFSNKFKHVPHALRRSTMRDMEEDFGADFERTASSQFRNSEDVSVSASLGHYYGYATGRSVPGIIRYFYADIARADTPMRLRSLLEQRNFDVFCLNDHDSSNVDPAEQARMISSFLQSYFPLRSPFEKRSDTAP